MGTQTDHPSTPRFLDAGDGHLVCEFGQDVSEEINLKVVALARAVSAARLAGVQEVLPTYRSLLLRYDPLAVEREALVAAIAPLAAATEAQGKAARRWHVPVAYGGKHGEDLEDVARQHGLTTDEVIALHSGASFRVFMIGFAPGFTYLGGLPESLHTPRRQSPRMMTPAGSISIGGKQAAVASIPTPSGWNLLGRTPVRAFDPRRNHPVLFAAGDFVSFHAISPAEFDRLSALAEKGEDVAESEEAA
ncbi:5-oxoprolinase subunit PxpB [Telmatospirillum sp. J64-1]|uniref:5-oxoprolinase subunit PxpB n=1 Tax=Telmatospirillum sp. J64-1 TaxID=2502183 RepID=UPI00115F2713|nr:5-oxoprolinase subunit PxpB [Telmatospirillum sp. J64-1]